MARDILFAGGIETGSRLMLAFVGQSMNDYSAPLRASSLRGFNSSNDGFALLSGRKSTLLTEKPIRWQAH